MRTVTGEEGGQAGWKAFSMEGGRRTGEGWLKKRR